MRQNAYYQTIALAAPEIRANDVRRADRLLDACPPELRRWEWGALEAALPRGEPLAGLPRRARRGGLQPRRPPAGRGRRGPGRAGVRRDLGRGHGRELSGRSAATTTPSTAWRSIPPALAWRPPAATGPSGSGTPRPGGRSARSGATCSACRAWRSAPTGGSSPRRARTGRSGSGTPRSGPSGGRSPGTPATIWAVAFSPDGSLLASAGGDRTIRLWDVAAARRSGRSAGTRGSSTASPSAPTGGSSPRPATTATARVWNAATGASCVVFRGHSRFVTGVVVQPGRSSRRFVEPRRDDQGLGVRLGRGRPDSPRAHRAASGASTSAGDGRRIASIGEDRSIKLWDASDAGAGRGIHAGPPSRSTRPPSAATAAGSPSARRAGTRRPQTVEVWDIARRAEASSPIRPARRTLGRDRAQPRRPARRLRRAGRPDDGDPDPGGGRRAGQVVAEAARDHPSPPWRSAPTDAGWRSVTRATAP